jgi:hypothetical protein
MKYETHLLAISSILPTTTTAEMKQAPAPGKKRLPYVIDI